VKKEGKVLIVDDDEDILTAGKLLLKTPLFTGKYLQCTRTHSSLY